MKSIAIKVVPLLLLLTAALTPAHALEGKKIQAIFEGEALKPVKLYSFSNDPYFSVREIAKVYGSRLVYSPLSGKVVLNMNNHRLDVYLKSSRVVLDNKKKHMSLPTRYVKGELYIPAAYILSRDFADFSETNSTLSEEGGVLTVERKVNIVSPRYYSRQNSTQIVIELLEDLPCNWTRKTKDTVLVSFPRGRLNADTLNINDGVVKQVALANDGRQASVRISLDAGAGTVEKKLLSRPSRLCITVNRPGTRSGDVAAEPVNTPAEIPVTLSSEPFNSAGIPVSTGSMAPAKGAAVVPAAAVPAKASAAARKKLVVLDAGHGGDDPGAIGPSGTKEKDLNLEIVQELKKLFEEDGDYQVFLTRTDDTFIPLVERTSLANERNADLFVSVHCNANDSRSVSGFEIYFLNEKASDPDAAATAFLENSVVNLEGKPSKKRAKLQELLWSMAKNECINESSELCSFITGEVTHRTRIENRGVKQAGFFVLRGAQMPAVLVECAFLSNYSEEAKLKSKKFKQYIADAIYEGVRKYDERRNTLSAKR